MFNSIIVAVALDHENVASGLLDRAEKLVDPAGTIRVVTVVEPIPAYVTAELPPEVFDSHVKAAEAALAALSASRTGFPIVTELRLGGPAAEIMAAAEEHGADLIMVASHKPGLSTYFIGSTAAKVTRHAQCSVLVVR